MNDLTALINDVEIARQAFLSEVDGLSIVQAQFKPHPEKWSITQITEHMVWAEQVGVMGMWKALQAFSQGTSLWEGSNPNKGLTIEEVVARTWQPKEQVPDVARPQWGGTLAYWRASLGSCAFTLQQLGKALVGQDLHSLIYPHPISGPLSVHQRLQFLRFHLNRHQGQIEKLTQHPQFPMG